MFYHAHIYFPQNEVDFARAFYKEASKQPYFDFYGMVEQPIGPHPTGMIELHFGDSTAARANEWLSKNRKSLTVLVHEDTGDDVRDHTENIVWFGPPVKLDFGFFE